MNRPAPVPLVWLVLALIAAIGVSSAVQSWHGQAVVDEIREGFRQNEVNRAAALAEVKAETIRNREYLDALGRKVGIEQAENDRQRALSLDHEAQERLHGLRR